MFNSKTKEKTIITTELLRVVESCFLKSKENVHSSIYNRIGFWQTETARKIAIFFMRVYLLKHKKNLKSAESANLLHIFRKPFPRNTSGWLLLNLDIFQPLSEDP